MTVYPYTVGNSFMSLNITFSLDDTRLNGAFNTAMRDATKSPRCALERSVIFLNFFVKTL